MISSSRLMARLTLTWSLPARSRRLRHCLPSARLRSRKAASLPSVKRHCYCFVVDIAYACWKNSERVSIHASVFQNHIKDFPSVDSSDLPPEHTIVVEADIRKAPKRRKSQKTFSEETPLPARVTTELRNKIYAQCGDIEIKDKYKVPPKVHFGTFGGTLYFRRNFVLSNVPSMSVHGTLLGTFYHSLP